MAELLHGLSSDVQREALDWFRVAKSAEWADFADVRRLFRDADMVNGLLVFNIRGNRYRLIVFPAFRRKRIYIKALLTHKQYMREDWKEQWR